MYLTGFSINVLTLLAIVLATGLVVDDGIVVTENIYKKVEAGMDPTQAAHEGSKEIFFAIVSTSITLAAVFLPIIFLQGFVGRLFREFGVVLAGAVLISAFVSLTLTPMLNAKMLRKGQKHSKFYQRTEPFFEWLNNSYRNLLARFMKKRYLAFVIILISGVLIFVVGKNLQSELAPLDDRSFLRMSIIAPEGVSYEYTDDYINKLAEFIDDSIPEKKVLLTVTAPSFSGSGAVNTGFARLTLTDPDQRQRSQQMIADYLSSKVRNFQQAKTFVLQQQTISAGGGGASSSFPVQYVLKTQDFDKLREAVPKFMDEAQKSKVFQGVDVNLKFNKPELDVEIDREKAKSLGLSVQDIAQTMQLAFSGQRFSYFEMFGNQYQVIAQFDRANRDEPLDLKSLFVRNNNGELIQLDNVVTVVEKSSPPQLYNFNRYESATISAVLLPEKL